MLYSSGYFPFLVAERTCEDELAMEDSTCKGQQHLCLQDSTPSITSQLLSSQYRSLLVNGEH